MISTRGRAISFSIRRRMIVPGKTCGYQDGRTVCAHGRKAHKYDEADGTAWCDECWASPAEALQQISSHTFDQGAYAVGV